MGNPVDYMFSYSLIMKSIKLSLKIIAILSFIIIDGPIRCRKIPFKNFFSRNCRDLKFPLCH